MVTISGQIMMLSNCIKHHNHQYYDLDAPEIDDSEYDRLLQQLIDLEDQHPELVSDDSPTRYVGGQAISSFKRVAHDAPMLSLADKFSEQEVADFYLNVELSDPNLLLTVEPKIDGLSVALRYKYGRFVQALTRGDGHEFGEDVTENVKMIASVPMTLETKMPYLEVRGEVFMSKESFEEVNAYQESICGRIFKNPRNAAAGTIRQSDPSIVRDRNLGIKVFDVMLAPGMNFTYDSEQLMWLEQQGFDVVDRMICSSLARVWEWIDQYQMSRESLTYEIDGAVIKIDSLSARHWFGATSKFPRWAIAYKYPPEEKTTEVRDIIIQVGRTGRLTPKAILKPVQLAGTTVVHATLHNQAQIMRLDVRIGDTVVVRKAAEIIPEVVRVVIENRPEGTVPYVIPDVCPVCGAPANSIDGSVDIYCTNLNCPAQLIRLIQHFCSRAAMDIEGMGPATVTALVESGAIKNIADIYFLEGMKHQLIAAKIIGKTKSVENLLAAIEKSKTQDIDRLFKGLGIHNVGIHAGRILKENFKSIKEIANATYEQLIALPDFGDSSARAMLSYFGNTYNLEMLDDMTMAGVNMNSLVTKSAGNELEGMTFVLTGTLHTMKRDDAASLIAKHGGKCSGSVSKKTTYVLAGEDAGSKLTKAETLGIKIISEEDLLEMLA
jgi:DNA ligase (NAD+)